MYVSCSKQRWLHHCYTIITFGSWSSTDRHSEDHLSTIVSIRSGTSNGTNAQSQHTSQHRSIVQGDWEVQHRMRNRRRSNTSPNKPTTSTVRSWSIDGVVDASIFHQSSQSSTDRRNSSSIDAFAQNCSANRTPFCCDYEHHVMLSRTEAEDEQPEGSGREHCSWRMGRGHNLCAHRTKLFEQRILTDYRRYSERRLDCAAECRWVQIPVTIIFPKSTEGNFQIVLMLKKVILSPLFRA